MHLKLLTVFSFILMFLYLPGSYIPLIHEKEVFFFLFIFIISIFNLYRVNKEQKIIILFKEKSFYFFFSLFIGFNLVFNIKKDFFNLEDYYYSIYFIISFFILVQFIGFFNKEEMFSYFKSLSLFICIQKIINIFQIIGFLKIFPVHGRTGITGTIGNINLLSFLLLIGIIIDNLLLKKESSKKWKYYFIINILLSLFLIGYNGARSVIITMFLIVLYYFLKNKTYYYFFIVIIPLITGILIGFRKSFFNSSVLQRFYIWKNCIYQFIDNFFTGTGIGNFKNAFNFYQDKAFKLEYSNFIPKDTFAMQAHNEILQLLAETGVLVIPFIIYFVLKVKFKKELECSTIKYILISTFCFSIFDFPFHIIGISFFIIIFFLFYLKKYLIKIHKKNSLFIIMILVFFIAISFKGLLFSAKKNLSYYYLAEYIIKGENISNLQRSISLYNNSRAYYELANYFFKNGDAEKGLEHIFTSINLSTEKAPVLSLARFLLKCGKIDESILYFIKGYKLDPADAELALYISDLLKKNGNLKRSAEFKKKYNKITEYRESGGKNGFMEIFIR